MKTPILDFLRGYAAADTLRLHMPGHKGEGALGVEPLDITEIAGADSLYEADGIIRESEENASYLFGARTYYTTEGSSHAIRAMLQLATQGARREGQKPVVLAGRNAHRAFLSAVALLDIEVAWLAPEGAASYLACPITPAALAAALDGMAESPAAVYLTSPDYLGNTVDIAALAAVCHARGILLLVDNAHGAYLRFLETDAHPISLGADMCADSAHKTLAALTGAAYLHLAPSVPYGAHEVKAALALFGSTSPSYLTLASLDALNATLAGKYPVKLRAFLSRLAALRAALTTHGYTLTGDEPMKLTLLTKPYGYTGGDLAALLRERGVECEFADPDHLVLMPTPALGEEGLARLRDVLLSLPRRTPVTGAPPAFSLPKKVLSVRQATLAPAEWT
ncbi:MAG: aminotransferase class V-fold PLP-dependent enzyme, partial [Clostridia bacterium]|nr:aminotransferase class V-fold PLP-dependent enzyme [Clostridia bacterium]